MDAQIIKKLKEAEGRRVIVQYFVNGQSEIYIGELTEVKTEGIYLGSFFIPFPIFNEFFHLEKVILFAHQIYP